MFAEIIYATRFLVKDLSWEPTAHVQFSQLTLRRRRLRERFLFHGVSQTTTMSHDMSRNSKLTTAKIYKEKYDVYGYEFSASNTNVLMIVG